MSKTLEQLRAEQARDKALLEQYQHRIQRLENRAKYLNKDERTARTHRLITRGAAVESIVPERNFTANTMARPAITATRKA